MIAAEKPFHYKRVFTISFVHFKRNEVYYNIQKHVCLSLLQSIGSDSRHDRDLRPVSFIPVGPEFFRKVTSGQIPENGLQNLYMIFPRSLNGFSF
jgi:hypothetical protein